MERKRQVREAENLRCRTHDKLDSLRRELADVKIDIDGAKAVARVPSHKVSPEEQERLARLKSMNYTK